MGLINPPLPTVGLKTTTEDAKTRTALSQIQDAVNNVVAAQVADNQVTPAKIDDAAAWQSVPLSATYFTAGSELFFYKDLSGVVHFKSDVTYTTHALIPANTTIATLSAGFRPAYTHNLQLQGPINPMLALDATGVLRTHAAYQVTSPIAGWWFQAHYVALG